MSDCKVLLIIGASSDVGSALIKAVAEKYDIILSHYNQSEEIVENMRSELGDKIIPIQADLGVYESVVAMIEQIRILGYTPDHIVHIAAPKAVNLKFQKESEKTFGDAFFVCVQSLVIILQAFLPYMVKKKSGKIVLMLSSYTEGMPPRGQSAYVTVKYALLGLMKCLAVEYASKGITVNGISPDMIETNFLSEVPEMIIEMHAANSPMKRNLSVMDVVPTFEYLLSDHANMVTGVNLLITGGN